MNSDIRPERIDPPCYPAYRLRDYLAAFAHMLESWRRREQLSMQLAHIDARTLRDAGISDAQRFIGVNHPFD